MDEEKRDAKGKEGMGSPPHLGSYTDLGHCDRMGKGHKEYGKSHDKKIPSLKRASP